MLPPEGPLRFEELLASARRGDRESFGRLMELHGAFLPGFVERAMDGRLRAVLDAEDVLQDVRVAAFRAISAAEFPGPGAFRRWLETITKHRLVDLARRHLGRRRREGQALSLDETVGRSESGASLRRRDLVPGADTSPSGIASRREAAEALEVVLSRIPPHYRDVIRFVVVERIPLREIATRLGRSPDAARKVLDRALLACGAAMREARGTGEG